MSISDESPLRSIADAAYSVLYDEEVQRGIADRGRAAADLRESQSILGAIIEGSLDCIFLKDREGRYRVANSAMAQMMGKASVEEVIGKDDAEVFPLEQARLLQESDRRVMASGEPAVVEEAVGGGGGRRVFQTMKAPCRDSEGNLVGVVGIARDVTERQRTEEALRRSERELRVRTQIADIFLTVPDDDMYGEVLGILLDALASKHGAFGYIDGNGDFVVPTMARGGSDLKIQNRSLFCILRSDPDCRVPEKTFTFPRQTWGNGSWPRAIRERRTNYTNEASKHLPEGHIAIRRHISMPLLHKGEVIGLIQVANKETDYTKDDIELIETLDRIISPVLNARLQRNREEKQRRLAEEGLRKSAAELAHSNEELERFAHVASHDLQEPLRTVTSYLQLLARRFKGQLPGDANEMIAHTLDAAKRMKRLINDLLSLARVGTRPISLAPTRCGQVLDEAVSNLGQAMKECGAELTRDSLPVLAADASQLAELLQNLIGNALKFRSKEPPRIHVSAVQRGDEWVFSVRDNGIGISPKHAERIFVAFQRLHGQAEYPGSGIGLAICKKIVERHGGRIWVESREGEGATFYFTIPVQRG